MTDILALDVATTTGWARGEIGAVPVCGSITFKGRGESFSDDVFMAALEWTHDLIADKPPDILILEKMLPPDAMKTRTSRAVRDRLAGLHGVIRAVARRQGVGEISEASVGDVRAHFLGERSLRRPDAKRVVMARCAALGWAACNDNEGDALALWSFACGLIDPAGALRMTPLFNRRLKISVWP